MKLDATCAKLLGLDTTDIRILKGLSRGDSTIASLSAHIQTPRTSLYYMLHTLKVRGLVHSYKKEKKQYWALVPEREVHESYMSALGFSPLKESSIVTDISDSDQVSIYQGSSNVMKVLTEISNLPPKSRFFGIQPEQSILSLVAHGCVPGIINFNEQVKLKGIIAEGIIHERGTDTMADLLPRELGKKLLASFHGRSADTAKMPASFLDGTKAEIYLYANKVAIVNWDIEFAVVIQNSDVFKLCMGMFTSTKYLMQRYDQNEKIARKLLD